MVFFPFLFLIKKQIHASVHAWLEDLFDFHDCLIFLALSSFDLCPLREFNNDGVKAASIILHRVRTKQA